jgi:hypothetical protein
VAQVGRISGSLLEANLLRQGIANNTQQNLSFKNTNSDTTLLKVDVANGRIGVDLEAPASELQISQTLQTTNLIASLSTTTPGFEITDSTFRVLVGDIYLNASEAIVMANMENGTIRISDNIVSTILSNANIDLTPNGTGTTEVLSNLNVFGDIYTPGNITFDGNITFGDSDTDTVTLETDLDSNIIPDQSDLYSLGTSEKRWTELYTNLVNGASVTVSGYELNGVDLLTKHGGIIYVAQEGNDANSGDHIFDPLATISEALSRAEASSDQPFTILVAAGDYQEALPLVVPNNVSVIGQDIRNTTIIADTSSQSEDVFHLSDKTLIANLTIKDYYYNSVNNTGYAFRFATDAVMSERSPYIQNVTVITQETSQGAGDAGRGAWIDGNELNAATVNKSMLFHSCTFISPGADVINMTNDVRVEWLNSFTYYANRGLYAFAGISGGAELRSIGSANVYGTYGAVADGADTLMYLIQHNFGYIGAGNKSDNDQEDVIQANEIVELNSGQIHFVSTDQKGNFRVGDNFFVDLESGNSSINIDTADIDALQGLRIVSPGGDTTVISSTEVTTGNITIANNAISTPTGDLNLVSATDTMNINNNTNIFGSLDIRDDFSFGGTLNIAGNQPGRDTAADTLTFNVDLEQDFKPHVTLTHNLGEEVRPWANINVDRAEIDDITIDENYITTDISNANLDLRSTNRIYVPNNDVQIDNNLTVAGTLDMQGTALSGTITYVGNRTQTGNYIIAGEISNGNILIEDNFITSTDSNSDLELRASGTGEILVPNNNVQIDNNLTVSTDTDLQGTTITGELTHIGDTVQTGNVTLNGEWTNGNLYIEDNFITTTGNLTLSATGDINVDANDVEITQDLTVSGATSLQDTTITGTVTHTGDRTQTGNLDIAGEISNGDISIEDNFISTTTSNSDLELRATGKILVPNNNVQINNNLTVDGTTNLRDTNVTGLLRYISDRVQIGDYTLTNYSVPGDIDIGSQARFEEILFDGNVITTTSTNTDLELRASGTGEILVPNNDVKINNNLAVNNITNNGNINVTSQTQFNEALVGDLTITQNYITTNNGNLDLELRANGTGSVYVEDTMLIDNTLDINGFTNLRNSRTFYKYGPELVINGTFDTNLNNWDQSGGGSARSINSRLQINATGAARNVSQEITVTPGSTYDFQARFKSVSNSNSFYLRVFESGVGTLYEWNESSGLFDDQVLTASFVPQGNTIDIIFRAVNTIVEWDTVSTIEDIGIVTEVNPIEASFNSVTQTGQTTQIGNNTQTGNVDITGDLLVSNEMSGGNINIDENIIRNFGEGLRPSNASNEAESIPSIVQSIINGFTAVDFIGQTEKNLVNFFIDNNYVDVNQSGTNTTSDYISYLQYIANGTTGNTALDNFIKSVLDEIIDIETATPGYFNSLLFDGDYFDPNLELRANGTSSVLFSNTDVSITNDVNVIGNTTLSSLISSTIIAPSLTASNTTTLDDNYISTTLSNANLELRAFENKLVYVPSNNVNIDNNITVNGTTNIDNTNIVGNITQTGNRTQVGNMSVVGTVTVSTSNIQDDLQLEDVLFDANVISSQDSNSNLELSAQGAGVVEVVGTDMQVDNDVTTEILNASNIKIDTSFTFEDFELSSNIQLFDNVITTTDSNSNLELRPSEGSNIVLQDLFLNADTLSTISVDITLDVNNNLTFDSNGAVVIPVGTASEDQLIDSGLRFNSTDNLFQAYKNNNLVTFAGIYSSNKLTSVLASPTNNTLIFNTNGVQTASIDEFGLNVTKLNIDDIKLENNIISTLNTDLVLRANGTGELLLDDITISQGTISNNSNAVLTFENNLYGAVKFNGNSVVIPYGTSSERPVTPEVGTTRWNTDQDVLEVWDGTQFVTSAGIQQSISAAEFDDLLLEYTLIFG